MLFPRSSRARLLRRAAILLSPAALWLAATSASPRASARREVADAALPAAAADTSRDGFWRALSLLDIATASRRAPDAEHRVFLDVLSRIMQGRSSDADADLRALTKNAADSILRRAAYLTLTSVLQYQGDWASLAALADDAPVSSPDEDGGRAGVASWAAAMRGAPRATILFPSSDAPVALERSAFGTPMIEVTIGGKQKHFWLDTGSALTLIASDVAAECGLSPLSTDSLEIVTTVGRVTAEPTFVPRIAFGGIVAEHIVAAIVSRQALSFNRKRVRHSDAVILVDGVIGIDLLRHFDIRLDFERSRVSLRRPAISIADRDRQRNLFWLGFPVVRLNGPNGGPMYFGLDTGADSTYATSALLSMMPRLGYRKRELRISGIGGDTTMLVGTLPELRFTIEGRAFRFDNLAIRDDRRLVFLDLAGVLGSDIARGGTMRIDLTNGLFRLSP
ncbi:MAG: retropepsin-like aspartic protease [Gemmatimonadaceae bacterium]